jgi:hypothetical protein
MSITHSVFLKKMTIYFEISYFPCFLPIFTNLKCYGCVKLKSTYHLNSKNKKVIQKIHEENECAESQSVNYVSDQTLTPLTFDNHIFFILCFIVI